MKHIIEIIEIKWLHNI